MPINGQKSQHSIDAADSNHSFCSIQIPKAKQTTVYELTRKTKSFANVVNDQAIEWSFAFQTTVHNSKWKGQFYSQYKIITMKNCWLFCPHTDFIKDIGHYSLWNQLAYIEIGICKNSQKYRAPVITDGICKILEKKYALMHNNKWL